MAQNPPGKQDVILETIVSTNESSTKITPGSAAVSPAARRCGEYELVEEIARGGMGVVYRAKQSKLNRTVALKMILAGQFASPEHVKRFYTEAEAAAKLDHPGIVPIYEVGEHDGQHYFSMGFVEGASLAERLRAGPLPPTDAAVLMQQIAVAIAYAHSQGVIHRDLKPANVLLDKHGVPKVTDFGLAKNLETDTGLTQSGSIMGTPSFMPPEQACGNLAQVGPLADVYSLGAMLYCLLTGRPPFQASSLAETIRQVIDVPPVALRRLNPEIPRDLETICLKCLRKEPELRYASAQALAQDLGCWLDNKPIAARPVGRVEKTLKWVNRKPALAAAYGLAGLSVVLIGLAAGSFWLWNQARYRHEQAEIARRVSEEGFQRESKLRATLDRVTYLNRIGLAYREWQDGNILRCRQHLEACPADLRGWEWRYVHRLLNTAQTTFTAHERMIRPGDLSPDGNSAVSGDDTGSVYLWDTTTAEIKVELQGHRSHVWSTIFSPDGTLVATCGSDGTIRMWDAASGQLQWKVAAHSGCVNGLAFSPGGTQLASVAGNITFGNYNFTGERGGATNEAKLWDVVDGREILAIPLSSAPLCVTYSASGKQLAIGQYGALSVRDALTGKVNRNLPGKGFPVWGVAFSPDGKSLATAHESNQAVLWNLADPRLSITLAHPKPVRGVSFTGDGSRVVTSCDDSLVRIWDSTGTLKKSLRGHIGPVNRVVIDRTGSLILSCGHDMTARIWDAQAEQQAVEYSPHRTWVLGVAGEPNDKYVVSAGRGGALGFWDSVTGELFQAPTKLSGHTPGFAISFDGNVIAAAAEDNAIELWEVKSRRRITRLVGHTNCVHSLAFSPDGRTLASGSHDYSVRLWDLKTNRVRRHFENKELFGRGVSFSPDGNLLAYGSATTLIVQDLRTEKRTDLSGHTTEIFGVAFSPDGQRVATAGHDHSIRIWDPLAGQHLLTCLGHSDMVFQVAYSPDGTRIASVSQDATVRVWLAETGEEALCIRGGTVPIYSVAFLKDGERLVSGNSAGTLQVWNSSYPLPVEPRLDTSNR